MPSHWTSPGADTGVATPATRTIGGRLATAIACLGALVLLVGGGVGLTVATRDHGYIGLGTADNRYHTRGFALATDSWDPGSYLAGAIGRVRIRYTPVDEKTTFVGVGTAAAVDRFLRPIQHTTVRHTAGGGYRRDEHAGSAPSMRPQDATLWVAESAGTGVRTLTWEPAPGDYRLVAMNSDGSPALSGRLDVAVRIPTLPWVSGGAILLGLLLAGAVALRLRRTRSR